MVWLVEDKNGGWVRIDECGKNMVIEGWNFTEFG